MTGAALASLRPRDETVSSVTAAIAAVAAERRSAEQRLAEARAARARAVADASCTPRKVAAIKAEARQIEIEIERLDLLAPTLADRLAGAKLAEHRAEVDRRITAATKAVDAYKVAMEHYAEHAAAIAAICRLGVEAQAAVRHAVDAGVHVAFEWPPGIDVGRLLFLPRSDGSTAFWGRYPDPEPLFRYQQ